MRKFHSLRYQLRPRHYLGGVIVMSFLIVFYATPIYSLFNLEQKSSWHTLLQDSYLHHIIWFSFWQASLSATLSVILGLLFARAFYYQSFRGKSLILKLFSLTFVLPALVAIFGLIGIYGRSGWLNQMLQILGLSWKSQIYGLIGILFAHLFFNIPLSAKIFLQSLHNIPTQQRKLAAQLNIRGWQFIRLIELPYFRQQLLPTFSLIFMLCFTSFTIVLALGGGPKYTTLEVAIYQAITFDFDLPKAALLALLQFVFCLSLFGVSSLFTRSPQTSLSYTTQWFLPQTRAVQIWQVFFISIICLFIFAPLVNTVLSGFFNPQFFSIWRQPQLWQAIGYSLALAFSSALISLLFSTALLLFARRLHWLNLYKSAQIILNMGMMILAIPTLVVAIGLFLLLQQMDFSHLHLFLIVSLCNALSTMPFVIRILTVPFYNSMIYYEKLCQALHITGWQRLRLIEWQTLQQPMKYAFALACTLSLGDFTAIALFGNQDFTSLPYLLYQQLGHYRSQEAAVTALILLLLCLGLFFIIEYNKEGQNDKN